MQTDLLSSATHGVIVPWPGSDKLNHASIVSTTIYTAVDREKLREAVGS